MFADFFHVFTFTVAIALLVWMPLHIGRLIRPRFPYREKQEVYECGEPTVGSSWVRYNIRFYQTALIFLLFDLEVVFLVPVALWLRPAAVAAGAGTVPAGLPWLVFAEVAVFVGVLVLGLAYAWRFGCLDWIRGDDQMKPEEIAEFTGFAEAPAIFANMEPGEVELAGAASDTADELQGLEPEDHG